MGLVWISSMIASLPGLDLSKIETFLSELFSVNIAKQWDNQAVQDVDGEKILY